MVKILGLIERRLLINFNADPEGLRRVLPAPFEPQVIHGRGLAGICLIRLKGIRPWGLPAAMGICSENAAHRIAVRWKEGSLWRTGVYIPRRDTSSHLNALLGGRLFPGVHHRASFEVAERGPDYQIDVKSRDGAIRIGVEGRIAAALPKHSVFADMREATTFFEAGSLGYSPTSKPGSYDGLELRCEEFIMTPFEVTRVQSTYFQDPRRFQSGSMIYDSAFLMKDVPHYWESRCGLSPSWENASSLNSSLRIRRRMASKFFEE